MTARIEFVDTGAAYRELRSEIDAAVAAVFESSQYIGGPDVAAFEEEWAAYTGAKHAIGVANGTDSLELILRALELPPGTDVLMPANTFIATAEAVVAAGLEARFVDVDPESGLADADAYRDALDDRVSAIAPVHIYGRLGDLSELLALARERGLPVIEDAAQAHGARRGGAHAGTFGVAGSFSFYPGKNLGAFGDAGAIVTDDDELAASLRVLRDHGKLGPDDHVAIGRNSRLDAVQAAVLRVKLRHLDRWAAERRRVAEGYRAALPADLLDWRGADDPQAESHHLFPVLVDDRDGLAAELADQGVPTGVHYRRAVPTTTAFGNRVEAFPVAESRAARQLSLPMHPHLSDEQVAHVSELVTSLVGSRI